MLKRGGVKIIFVSLIRKFYHHKKNIIMDLDLNAKSIVRVLYNVV